MESGGGAVVADLSIATISEVVFGISFGSGAAAGSGCLTVAGELG